MEVYSDEAQAYSQILNITNLDSYKNKTLTLEELIHQLHNAFSTDRVDIDHVQMLMSSYRSNPQDWKKFAKFDRHR